MEKRKSKLLWLLWKGEELGSGGDLEAENMSEKQNEKEKVNSSQLWILKRRI